MRGRNLVPHDYDFDLVFSPNSMKGEDLIATSKKVIQVCKNLGLRTKEKSHGHLTAYIEISGLQRAVDFLQGGFRQGFLCTILRLMVKLTKSCLPLMTRLNDSLNNKIFLNTDLVYTVPIKSLTKSSQLLQKLVTQMKEISVKN